MQFWHRNRSARPYAKVRTWSKTAESTFLGFAGYKAGMTHIIAKDNYQYSMSKDEDIFIPVTIIECPPLKIFSIKFYSKTTKGLKCAGELFLKSDKELERKIRLAKKTHEEKLADFEKKLDNYYDIRVVVYTQPKLTGIGKKKPDVFELGIGGKNLKEKLDHVKKFIGKDITAKNVLKPGQQVDLKGVSTGKGFQGTTKRFGTAIRGRKTEKAKRGIGTLGPWHPHRVLYTVPQPGKMGYHCRTEYNKWIVSISDKPAEINPKGGFVGYGLVKNTYLMIKGSVVGPSKRVVRMIYSIRPNRKIIKEAPSINYISIESKQQN